MLPRVKAAVLQTLIAVIAQLMAAGESVRFWRTGARDCDSKRPRVLVILVSGIGDFVLFTSIAHGYGNDTQIRHDPTWARALEWPRQGPAPVRGVCFFSAGTAAAEAVRSRPVGWECQTPPLSDRLASHLLFQSPNIIQIAL